MIRINTVAYFSKQSLSLCKCSDCFRALFTRQLGVERMRFNPLAWLIEFCQTWDIYSLDFFCLIN